MQNNNTTASAFRFTIDLRRAGFAAGASQAIVEALVRLEAPPAPAGAHLREPLTLALVIDRSGSMAGASLHEAKQCARTIVQSLADGDRAAVIAFDDEVDVMCPVVGTDHRGRLIAAIDAIDSAGSTDLHSGWLEGARVLGRSIVGRGVYRVVLLSDGAANRGETDLETIAASCRDLAKQGISTSTYGLGHQFNEDLMLAMAKAGRGNAYYGQTAQDLAEPFHNELALLSSLCARGMVLKVNAPRGVQVALRNDYEPAESGAHAWKLPDLAFGAEAWAYLKLVVPNVYLSESEVHLPLSVSVKAAGVGSTPLFFMATLPALSRMSRETLMTTPPDPLVESRRDELAAGETLELVRGLIAHARWDAAAAAVEKAQRRFASNPWCKGILDTMERMVARRDRFGGKEAAYACANLRRRLAAADEFRLAPDAADIPAFLRRKTEQGRGRRP
ncbi:MAG TPA: VWA domain-containing protein [Casimicrobiaceae bacterium]|nr:VWA domain-containing protein [Casimicrobiaceae bacterium]